MEIPSPADIAVTPVFDSVIDPVAALALRPTPETAKLVTPELVNVTESAPALVVMLMPVPLTKVRVSVGRSATTLDWPLTAIVWNMFWGTLGAALVIRTVPGILVSRVIPDPGSVVTLTIPVLAMVILPVAPLTLIP